MENNVSVIENNRVRESKIPRIRLLGGFHTMHTSWISASRRGAAPTATSKPSCRNPFRLDTSSLPSPPATPYRPPVLRHTPAPAEATQLRRNRSAYFRTSEPPH